METKSGVATNVGSGNNDPTRVPRDILPNKNSTCFSPDGTCLSLRNFEERCPNIVSRAVPNWQRYNCSSAIHNPSDGQSEIGNLYRPAHFRWRWCDDIPPLTS